MIVLTQDQVRVIAIAVADEIEARLEQRRRAKQGGGGEPGRPKRPDKAIVEAIVQAVRTAEERGRPLLGRKGVCDAVSGSTQRVGRAFKQAMREGLIWELDGALVTEPGKQY